MTEPSRKRNKDQRSTNLTIGEQHLPSEPAKNLDKSEDPLIFWSVNQEDPFLVDLTEFAKGKTAADITAGKRRWVSDYRGRPNLIAELVPAIKYLYSHLRAPSLNLVSENLRFWWRVFEKAEAPTDTGCYIPKPVESVADLQMLHHHIAKNMRVASRCHAMFVRIANLVRSQKGLQPLDWPSIEREQKPSDAPETWEIERIRRELKRQWFGSLARWKAADASKSNLWGWKKTYYKERSKHAHEVYRAVVDLTGHPLPSIEDVREAIGFSSTPEWMQPIVTPISGLYPTCDDVRAAFILCLMYSGWNISTLVTLKVDGRFVETHPTNSGYHVAHGFKNRGQSEQYCIGRNKRLDAPGTILRTLVERTRPLRELVKKQLVGLETQLADGAASVEEVNSLLEQCKTLKERARSPWLYADPHGFAVVHINSDNLNYRRSYKSQGTYLANFIRTINLHQPADRQIRESIAPGDLRDSYVGFTYEFSNYSVLTAQIAAGHKSVGTTQDYLRHKRWKAHSAKTIQKFQTFMFREIGERKSVDATILRAHMEWGDVTDEERVRLSEFRKNRSRIGVGCKDPNSPPQSMARNHKGGGCRIQRCTLCPQNAILLPDSYDGIAMRVAELEFLRHSIPVTSWVNSQFPLELENAESALELYDPQRVQGRLAHWRREIQEGHHKPILLDGTY